MHQIEKAGGKSRNIGKRLEGIFWYQKANFNFKISTKRGNFYFHEGIPMKGGSYQIIWFSSTFCCPCKLWKILICLLFHIFSWNLKYRNLICLLWPKNKPISPYQPFKRRSGEKSNKTTQWRKVKWQDTVEKRQLKRHSGEKSIEMHWKSHFTAARTCPTWLPLSTDRAQIMQLLFSAPVFFSQVKIFSQVTLF